MDLAIVLIDKQKGMVEFAGAKNPIVYFQDSQLFYLKADRYEIGGTATAHERNYSKHQVALKKDQLTTFYLFTDGYPDQFGGAEGRCFSIKRFREFLHTIHQLPLQEQKDYLVKNLARWQGRQRQIDDICIVGFKM
jgi:serine phosphatase RsbU (regulator of sigma subunit)